MNIIRLSDGQRRCLKIEHPLLDEVEKIDSKDLEKAIHQYKFGEESARKFARDDLIMGHLYCVKNIVGRFLAHWPESKRFEEDMISEGMVAVVNTVNELSEEDSTEDFQKKIWGSIKDFIETMLNDARSMFSASKRENYLNIQEGKEAVYNYPQSLHDGIDCGAVDVDPAYIDFMDDLEQFSEIDREHFRNLIVHCLSSNYGLEEEELTEQDKISIEAVSRILGEL